MTDPTNKEIVSEIHAKNTQDVITLANALTKILNSRKLSGAKKTAEKALKKCGYL